MAAHIKSLAILSSRSQWTHEIYLSPLESSLCCCHLSIVAGWLSSRDSSRANLILPSVCQYRQSKIIARHQIFMSSELKPDRIVPYYLSAEPIDLCCKSWLRGVLWNHSPKTWGTIWLPMCPALPPEQPHYPINTTLRGDVCVCLCLCVCILQALRQHLDLLHRRKACSTVSTQREPCREALCKHSWVVVCMRVCVRLCVHGAKLYRNVCFCICVGECGRVEVSNVTKS